MAEQKNITVTVTDEAYDQLRAAALADLSNGGRGVGNQVEALLINPLSRWLFDNGITGDARVELTAFETAARPACVVCRRLED